MTDLFFDIATSAPALGLDVLVLLAALVVGWFPFGDKLPIIGPYVKASRLVAVLVALVLVFFLGFRVCDERDELRKLRATLLIKNRDVEAADKSAADAKARVSLIEKWSDAQRKADAEYIATLEAGAKRGEVGCPFDPGPAAGGVRVKPEPIWRWRFGNGGSRSPAETR